jgi:hypothetical protein
MTNRWRMAIGEVPWWFGDDEDSPPFLRASVEPTGLFDVRPATDCPRGCEI